MVKYVFSHSKLRKQPFFAKIVKIQVGAKPPCHPPSDAHAWVCANAAAYMCNISSFVISWQFTSPYLFCPPSSRGVTRLNGACKKQVCRLHVRIRTVARKSPIRGFTFVRGGLTFVQGGLTLKFNKTSTDL